MTEAKTGVTNETRSGAEGIALASQAATRRGRVKGRVCGGGQRRRGRHNKEAEDKGQALTHARQAAGTVVSRALLASPPAFCCCCWSVDGELLLAVLPPLSTVWWCEPVPGEEELEPGHDWCCWLSGETDGESSGGRGISAGDTIVATHKPTEGARGGGGRGGSCYNNNRNPQQGKKELWTTTTTTTPEGKRSRGR